MSKKQRQPGKQTIPNTKGHDPKPEQTGNTFEEKFKGKRYGGRKPGKGSPHEEADPHFPSVPSSAANSVAWHNKESSLYEGATKIQTFKMAGSITQPRAVGGNLALSPNRYPTNKIIAYYGLITPGYLSDTGDPFNKCMIDLFNAVRGRYTSQIPFQANDLGTVIIAVGAILAEIGLIKRAFKLLRWNAVDSYITPELLHAAAVGTDTFATSAMIHHSYRSDASQAANLAFLLDVEIARLQGLSIPKMAFFDFCNWVFRYAYFDDKGATRGDVNLITSDSMYFWNPQVAVRGATGVYASGLTRTTLGGYLTTGQSADISCHIAMLHDAISALVQDDSVRTISGWLNQNFSDCIRADELANIQDTEVPESGEEMEYLIRGAKFYNGIVPNVQQDITKETLYAPLVVSGTPDPQWIMNHLVNFPEKPDADKIMLSSIGQAACNGKGSVYTDVLMLRAAALFSLDEYRDYVIVGLSTYLDEATPATCYSSLIAWSSVNTKPTLIGYTVVSSSLSTAGFYSDISYQVNMDWENVKNMHTASMMSLFKAPTATK